jgi:hypothetical protein
MGGRVWDIAEREGGSPSRMNFYLSRTLACIGLFFVVK